MLSGRRILLGVAGGIAAYKSAELARALTVAKAEVTVVMTANARRFIAPLTFRTLTGRPVATKLFADPDSPLPHISLARWAELVVLAPATADLIARVAVGRANDLLAAILLDTSAPILWAPAMNARMWQHTLTQDHVRRLAELGQHFVGPAAGELACGEEGPGRLAPVEEILAAVQKLLIPSGPLVGKRVLITAGPTREPWDAVRFISNRSSGRMGYSLADEARRRGADVTLVSGPVALDPVDGVRLVRVTTADEMHAAVLQAFPQTDIVIAAAAVSDFRPAEAHTEKIKKHEAPASLALASTPDILAELGQRKEKQLLVGFAAETDADLTAAGSRKLLAKHLDLVVANRAAGPEDAFEAEQAAAVLLEPGAEPCALPRQPKPALAAAILDRVADLLARRTTL